jgi:hypothetical protein
MSQKVLRDEKEAIEAKDQNAKKKLQRKRRRLLTKLLEISMYRHFLN